MKSVKIKVSIITLTLAASLLGGCSSNTNVSVKKDSTASNLIKNNTKSTKSNEKDEITEYLKLNYSALNAEKLDDFSDLALIDAELKDREIFLTAEHHGIKANTELRMKFFKYFKEKTNFKYYLCEIPYSDAYFYNKFLESGDMKLLEEIYKPSEGTLEWNEDSYNHWKELYEFNKSLPQDKKIQIIGVDIEHQPTNALRYMYTILPKKESPKEIAEILNEFKDIWNHNKELNKLELKEFCEKLKKNIENNENIYKEYLGENFLGFNLVNNNILYLFEVHDETGDVPSNQIRDKRMYENFKQIYDTLPKNKYYGQWGLNHTYQKEHLNVKSLAASINDEGSSLKNKVLTIAYAYDGCKCMVQNKNRTYSTGYLYSFNSIEFNMIDNFTEGNYNLFKLNSENSPFKNKIIWPLSDVSKPKDGVTTDYFQYFVLIKNSEASEPLNHQYE